MKRITLLFGKKEEFTRMTLFMFMEQEQLFLMRDYNLLDVPNKLDIKHKIKQHIEYAGDNNWNVISTLEN